MKKVLLSIIALFLGFNAFSQELIIESVNTTPIFNNETFQTETTKIYVYVDNVFIRWNEDGTGGNFSFSARLVTASGNIIVNRTLSKPISVLDSVNVPTSVHTYIRDQIYNAVTAVDPFGLTDWTKLY